MTIHTKYCPHCGETKLKTEFYKRRGVEGGSGYCKSCSNSARTERTFTNKLKAIKYAGGKCVKCGYNKNHAALHFHHLNPNEKDINFKYFRHWSWERIKTEVDKCSLLCANCHAEAHHPLS